MMSKPKILIIPGAWQRPMAFNPTREKLLRAGYTTDVVELPSVGGSGATLPGLTEDVAAVRIALDPLVDAGCEIVLLCHSYGGLVGSNAVEGFDVKARARNGKTGGVCLVLYVSAFVIPSGKSLLDSLGGEPLPWMDILGDKVLPKSELIMAVVLNDVQPERAATFSTQITHSSASVFVTPSAYEPWLHAIPCAYIFCTIDNAIPLLVQQHMASLLGPHANTATLESGHCPYFSVPDQLADAVVRLSVI